MMQGAAGLVTSIVVISLAVLGVITAIMLFRFLKIRRLKETLLRKIESDSLEGIDK